MTNLEAKIVSLTMEQGYYAAEIARICDVKTGTIGVTLTRMLDKGYLEKKEIGLKVYYRATGLAMQEYLKWKREIESILTEQRC